MRNFQVEVWEDGELPFEFQVYRPDLTLLKEFNLR